MDLTINSVIKRNPDIVFSDIDDEVVMMSIEQGEYYGMDPIGSEIWQMLDKELSVEDICHDLCGRYDVSESVCQKDVLGFLEKMLARKVISAE